MSSSMVLATSVHEKPTCYGNHSSNTKHVEAIALYSTVGVYWTWVIQNHSSIFVCGQNNFGHDGCEPKKKKNITDPTPSDLAYWSISYTKPIFIENKV